MDRVAAWTLVLGMYAAIAAVESYQPAHANPCDFTNGGSPEACAGSQDMQEMEDYACDQWGTDCGAQPAPEPQVYYPELIPDTITYQIRTGDGFTTVTRDA
jgi:hypothetical protein